MLVLYYPKLHRVFLGPHIKANATGRNFKTLREFLEKHYKDGDMTTDKCIELAIKCLMEVSRVCIRHFHEWTDARVT